MVIAAFVIIGFLGAGAAAFIPRGGSGTTNIDADAIWAFRANPRGYLTLMEQTWLADGTLDRASVDELVDIIASDCRVDY